MKKTMFLLLAMVFLVGIPPAIANEIIAKEVAPQISETEPPLMLIRFKRNQLFNYYQPAMRKAVENAEKSAVGVNYEVVSLVPSNANGLSKSQVARYNKQATDNLKSVVAELTANGIDSTRIKISTQNSANIDQQEIRVYVNSNVVNPDAL